MQFNLSEVLCNCDDMEEQSDHGILSNKKQLPVTSLNFGDSAGRYNWIEYRLGPLRCSGKSGLYPSELGSSLLRFKYYHQGSDPNLTPGNVLKMTKMELDESGGKPKVLIEHKYNILSLLPVTKVWNC